MNADFCGEAISPGSTDVVTDGAGGVFESRSYDAFGTRRNPSWGQPPAASYATPSSPMGFTGHEEEADLGLANMRGRIYDPKLGPNEVQGDYSGRPDDRWIFTTNNPFFQWNASAALAVSVDVLKGYDDALAKDCLDTAKKAWDEEKTHPTPMPGSGVGGGAPTGASGGVLAASQGVVSGAQGGRSPQGTSSAATSSGATSAPTAAPAGSGRGVRSVSVDGRPVPDLVVELADDGRQHEVEIALGS